MEYVLTFLGPVILAVWMILLLYENDNNGDDQ